MERKKKRREKKKQDRITQERWNREAREREESWRRKRDQRRKMKSKEEWRERVKRREEIRERRLEVLREREERDKRHEERNTKRNGNNGINKPNCSACTNTEGESTASNSARSRRDSETAGRATGGSVSLPVSVGEKLPLTRLGNPDRSQRTKWDQDTSWGPTNLLAHALACLYALIALLAARARTAAQETEELQEDISVRGGATLTGENPPLKSGEAERSFDPRDVSVITELHQPFHTKTQMHATEQDSPSKGQLYCSEYTKNENIITQEPIPLVVAMHTSTRAQPATDVQDPEPPPITVATGTTWSLEPRW